MTLARVSSRMVDALLDEGGLVLVDGFRLCQIQIRLELPGAGFITLQSQPEQAFVVHGQVGIARVQLAFHAEEAGVHVDLHFFRHQRLAAGAEIVVLPEGGDVPQLLFGLFRNIEDVAVTLLEEVQLVHDELHGVLREDRCAAVHRGLVADEDRLIFNVNIHPGQNVLEHQRPLHDRGLVHVLFISFRGQDCALRVDVGLLVQDALAVCLHSGGKGSELRFVLHNLCLSLICQSCVQQSAFKRRLIFFRTLFIIIFPLLVSIYNLYETKNNYVRNFSFTYKVLLRYD